MSEAALKDLATLGGLRKLKLFEVDLTEGGLEALTALEELTLFAAKLPTGGLERVAAIKGLKKLNLMSTRVSELKELAGLVDLQELDLHRCPGVTNASIRALHTLKGLRTLDLSCTAVTKGGVARLQKALPDCKIHARELGQNTLGRPHAPVRRTVLPAHPRRSTGKL